MDCDFSKCEMIINQKKNLDELLTIHRDQANRIEALSAENELSETIIEAASAVVRTQYNESPDYNRQSAALARLKVALDTYDHQKKRI